MAILGRLDWIDRTQLRDFILNAQDDEAGGIADRWAGVCVRASPGGGCVRACMEGRVYVGVGLCCLATACSSLKDECSRIADRGLAGKARLRALAFVCVGGWGVGPSCCGVGGWGLDPSRCPLPLPRCFLGALPGKEGMR